MVCAAAQLTLVRAESFDEPGGARLIQQYERRTRTDLRDEAVGPFRRGDAAIFLEGLLVERLRGERIDPGGRAVRPPSSCPTRLACPDGADERAPLIWLEESMESRD